MQQYEVPPPRVTNPNGYEFTSEQNNVISRLSTRMYWAGIVQIVFGALQLVGNCSVQSGPGEYKIAAVSSPFYLVIIIVGALLVGASRSFKRIATTEGADIRHLMSALGSLSQAALVEIISFIVLGVLAILAIVMLVVVTYFLATMFRSAFS